MKNRVHISCLFVMVVLCGSSVRAQSLVKNINSHQNQVFQSNLETDYYFPSSTRFSTAVPSPAAFFGRHIGHFHTRYDEVLQYFKELERTSDRAKLDTIGYTWERRPLVVLKISSANNLKRIEELREDHTQSINSAKGKNTGQVYSSGPAFAFLGFSVHGNESSAADASLLTAYYLAAGEGEAIEKYLDQGVYFIDPVRNPDGYDRYVNWINANTSYPAVSNPLDREHNETWPGGRTNHYWFDLNRDWVNQVHPESKARVAYFQKWLPQIQGDFHEMGASSSYFFEPTKPDAQESPWVPKSTYVLNNVFAQYYAKALDTIGSLYYTKEQFDNINPTYGSSYPDHVGSLGILFEQASPRGLIQQTEFGDLTYPFAIRNHVRIALATIEGVADHKVKLQENQTAFFKSALALAAKDPIKAYLVDAKDKEQTIRSFTELLTNHQIEFSINEQDRRVGNDLYEGGKSILIPTSQANYRLVKVIFDEAKEYIDSVFYDGSGNSVAYLYGIKYAAIKQAISTGRKESVDVLFPQVPPIAFSNYGYLVNWQQDRAPWFLAQLLAADIRVKVASAPFSISSAGKPNHFSYGSLFIPVAGQVQSAEKVQQTIQALASSGNLKIISANSGFSSAGVDLGSNQFKIVKSPQVLLLTGAGVNAYEAGEVWHNFEQELGRSIVRVNTEVLPRVDLNEFQVIILVNGEYSSIDKNHAEKLASWIKAGGTLIAYGRAGQWLSSQQITHFTFASEEKRTEKKSDTGVKDRFNYASANLKEGVKRIGGAYFKTEIDTTHPIGYGYANAEKVVYRNHSLFVDLGNQPYNNVAVFSKSPLLNGYASKDNQKNLEGTSSILVENIGGGRVVYFIEDPLFRGVSFGNARSFHNAVFFGQLIRGSSRR